MTSRYLSAWIPAYLLPSPSSPSLCEDSLYRHCDEKCSKTSLRLVCSADSNCAQDPGHTHYPPFFENALPFLSNLPHPVGYYIFRESRFIIKDFFPPSWVLSWEQAQSWIFFSKFAENYFNYVCINNWIQSRLSTFPFNYYCFRSIHNVFFFFNLVNIRKMVKPGFCGHLMRPSINPPLTIIYISDLCNIFLLVLGGMIEFVARKNPFPRNYECLTCNRQYKSRQGLYIHKKYECGKDPQFQCPHCPFKARQKCNIKSHIISRHLSVTV